MLPRKAFRKGLRRQPSFSAGKMQKAKNTVKHTGNHSFLMFANLQQSQTSYNMCGKLLVRSLLGPTLARVGRRTPFGGHIGPSWAHLGPILGPTWAILGQLGTNLGPSWANLGPTWGNIQLPRRHLLPDLAHLGPNWALQGRFGRPTGLLRSIQGVVFGPVWGSFWSSIRPAWGNL